MPFTYLESYIIKKSALFTGDAFHHHPHGWDHPGLLPCCHRACRGPADHRDWRHGEHVNFLHLLFKVDQRNNSQPMTIFTMHLMASKLRLDETGGRGVFLAAGRHPVRPLPP